jgi:hypothetical protein
LLHVLKTTASFSSRDVLHCTPLQAVFGVDDKVDSPMRPQEQRVDTNADANQCSGDGEFGSGADLGGRQLHGANGTNRL